MRFSIVSLCFSYAGRLECKANREEALALDLQSPLVLVIRVRDKRGLDEFDGYIVT